MGICSGFGIPIAQKFGAKDYEGLRKYVANSVWLSIDFAVVMTIVTAFACRDILELMRTPDDIIDQAYAYILIIFLGIPVTFLYNILASFIRALGDSKTPVIFLTLASVINIGLDLLLMIPFQMGVAGAALATVISQGISGVCCLFYMVKKFEILKLSKEEWKANSHLMFSLCNMGIPMGLQYSITAIGSVVLQSAVNSLGSVAVASMTAGSKLGLFIVCPFDAMGATMATYGGQNVGAKKLDRLNSGLKSCVKLGLLYSIIAMAIIVLFGKQLALLFVDAGETVILNNVYLFLIINGSCYFLLALVNIVRFLIQGMGFSRFAILAGVFEMVARALVGFGLVPIMGFVGACLGSPVAWLMADIFLIPAYFHVKKKLTK